MDIPFVIPPCFTGAPVAAPAPTRAQAAQALLAVPHLLEDAARNTAGHALAEHTSTSYAKLAFAATNRMSYSTMAGTMVRAMDAAELLDPRLAAQHDAMNQAITGVLQFVGDARTTERGLFTADVVYPQYLAELRAATAPLVAAAALLDPTS